RPSIAARSRPRFSGEARTAKSASRLNSAAPYSTQAWPPIRRARTPCVRIVERTLGIGLGLKAASKQVEGFPQAHALGPPLLRAYQVPGEHLLLDTPLQCGGL